MKRFIVNTLAVFGVLFICLILAIVYLFIADPFNLKPMFSGVTIPAMSKPQVNNTETAATENDAQVPANESVESVEVVDTGAAPTDRVVFTLSAGQRQALINLGVSPDSIPTSLSFEQEQCFVNVLGQARVEEIKAGAIPGPIEFIRAQACI